MDEHQITLTLLAAAMLLRVANLAKLYREDLNRIASEGRSIHFAAPALFAECGEVNRLLVEVQNVGLKDWKGLDHEVVGSFLIQLEAFVDRCQKLLDKLEEKVKEDSQTVEEDVHELITKLAAHRLQLGKSLSTLQRYVSAPEVEETFV